MEALHISFGIMIQAVPPGSHSVSQRCGGFISIAFLAAQVVYSGMICFQHEL